MEKFRAVSDSELVIMRILWDCGGVALYADIISRLKEQKNEWSLNMVLILLRRLVDKGFIKTGKIGRRNKYTAIITREEYNSAEAQQLIDRLYDGDVNGLVNTLGQMVPKDDQDKVRASWKGDESGE